MAAVSISAFYKFFDVTDPAKLRASFEKFGKANDLKGLILIASEGINGTVAGNAEGIDALESELQKNFGEMLFKRSKADRVPFKRFHVKIREEIVALGDTTVRPSGPHNHLTPEEWEQSIETEDVMLVDARNDYETAIGMFEGAIDPKLETFGGFSAFAKSADIPKDKKVLLYCTGGIRCEKAALAMEREGYQHVYQLQGGILAYLQKFPDRKFKGECFVFDHRAAVDQALQPSGRYKLCPHCGDPGDVRISCHRCGTSAIICPACAVQKKLQTCSKNCSYHLPRNVSAPKGA